MVHFQMTADVLFNEQLVKFKGLIAKAWLTKNAKVTHKTIFAKRLKNGDTGIHYVLF